jgi:hypothetical protein
MLYSKNGSYPAPLPHRITLSSGMTRTDVETFTPEEIADAGYVEVSPPPQADYPNIVDWDGGSWLVREPNEAEVFQRWEAIKQQCTQLLEETDYKVIKAVEIGELPPANYVQYRQELRDLYNNINNVDPWFVNFPVLQEPDES